MKSKQNAGNGVIAADADDKVGANSSARPDPEFPAKARRRRFSAEHKLRVLREADACEESGGIGALLRREGLCSSHLSDWRRARERGELEALAPKKRGRKPNKDARQVAALERENERLRARLERAEKLLALQKKVSELLEVPLAEDDDGRS